MWLIAAAGKVAVKTLSDFRKGGFPDIHHQNVRFAFLVTEKKVHTVGILVRPELLLPRRFGNVHERIPGYWVEKGDRATGIQMLVERIDAGIDAGND